jgi:tetratricopeptide (TPR) repeat protein
MNQLQDVYDKSMDQITESINDLKRHNIIDEIKDKRGNIWIFLKTDIVFPTFFPEYIVDSIRRRWMEKGISQNLALGHLELLKSVYRGEEEEFIEGFEGPRVRVEEEIPGPKIPTKVPERVAPVIAESTKTLSDEELFKLVEQVTYLRKEAKLDLDNKDRESAYNKLQEAIKITNDLIAAGAVGQEKRLEKLKQVADSVKKLLEKETGKKVKETPIVPTKAAPRFPTLPSAAAGAVMPSSVDQQKILREERDDAIASADKSLTGGEFNDAVSYLERAAELSERMGEIDKARDITKMANDIKKKLEKLQ